MPRPPRLLILTILTGLLLTAVYLGAAQPAGSLPGEAQAKVTRGSRRGYSSSSSSPKKN